MMRCCGGGFVWTGRAHWETVLGKVLGRVLLRVMQWICAAVENGLVGDVASFLMDKSIDWSGVVHAGDYGVNSHAVASEPWHALVIGWVCYSQLMEQNNHPDQPIFSQ